MVGQLLRLAPPPAASCSVPGTSAARSTVMRARHPGCAAATPHPPRPSAIPHAPLRCPYAPSRLRCRNAKSRATAIPARGVLQRRSAASTRTNARSEWCPALHFGPSVLSRARTVAWRCFTSAAWRCCTSGRACCRALGLLPGISPPRALLGRLHCRHASSQPITIPADWHALLHLLSHAG
jgi:hypothetical protein